MTGATFNQLSADLHQLYPDVPLKWGDIQNDVNDCRIEMFKIHSFAELQQQLAQQSIHVKNYFTRRWFLWKCAQCDEHIFCINNNVLANPNAKDQAYDIEFNGDAKLRFDVKGTVVPENFRHKIEDVLKDPSQMVHFFYDKQSKGIRNAIQNRLFVVHHSYLGPSREMYLRCQWQVKTELYKIYCQKVSSKANFMVYKNVLADVIFIIERADGTIAYKFFAV